MRRISWHLPVLLPLLTLAAPVGSQQPPQPPAAGERNEAREQGRPNRRQGQRPGRRRGQRGPVVAITAAMVHPVSGPAIENGVVLIRGQRIVAVGPQGEVTIPEGATTKDFPTGHVYPGLIDAETDAFTDPATQSGQLDHGSALADDLQLRHTRDDELVAAGITAAYVSARGGQGAVVRTRRDGFEVWQGKDTAALQLRLTQGPVPTHALTRQQQLDGLLKTFDGLEQYEKSKADYEKALDKYAEDFEKYLAWHKENKGKQPAAGEGATTTPRSRPEGRSERGGRPGRGSRGRRGERPPGGGDASGGERLEAAFEELLLALADTGGQDPKPATQDPKPAAGDNKPDAEQKDAEQAESGPPKRPTYPRPVKEDPAKEALLAVLAGTLPLRVEAHRPDELRAALKLQADQNVPVLVLEQAYGAAGLADKIAAAGASVVVTEVLPNSMPKLYEAFDPCELPRALHEAGVAFAIATGRARRASLLPMMAATAVGKGLPRDAALRAITLTPAEILGIQSDTGSLTRGKFADLVVFDRPLFSSDSRVLFVLGRGRTEFEVK